MVRKIGCKMNAKKLVPIAAVAGLLLTMGGIGASAANADNSVSYTTGGHTRVSSYYNTSSNNLSVTDNYSDGYGGRSLWSRTDGASGHLDNDTGAGTTTYLGIGGSGSVKFDACTKNGATTVACSGNVSATA
jgi:hypothetical protein